MKKVINKDCLRVGDVVSIVEDLVSNHDYSLATNITLTEDILQQCNTYTFHNGGMCYSWDRFVIVSPAEVNNYEIF